jgi:hypothetical protein
MQIDIRSAGTSRPQTTASYQDFASENVFLEDHRKTEIRDQKPQGLKPRIFFVRLFQHPSAALRAGY